MRIIEQWCPMCNTYSCIEVDAECYEYWKQGALIQNAFPNLEPKERELIKTGYCYPCQEILFAMPEEDEDGNESTENADHPRPRE